MLINIDKDKLYFLEKNDKSVIVFAKNNLENQESSLKISSNNFQILWDATQKKYN